MVPSGRATMDKGTWTSLLAASGFTEEDMERWHAEFERSDPDKHERFLRFLGIEDEEVRAIREAARGVPRRLCLMGLFVGSPLPDRPPMEEPAADARVVGTCTTGP